MKKLILNFVLLFAMSALHAQENNNLEQKIVGQWMDYSKAFEYMDYERIANHFSYPAIFNNKSPIVIKDKKMMVAAYKSARENIQQGYKYSLLENWTLLNISNSHIIFDARYARFNGDYEKIHSGRGLYTYKKINGEWLMSAINTIE